MVSSASRASTQVRDRRSTGGDARLRRQSVLGLGHLLRTSSGVDAQLVQTPLFEAIAAPAHLLDQNLAKAPARDDVEEKVQAVVEQIEHLGHHLAHFDVDRRRLAAHALDADDQPENEVREVQYAEGDRDDDEHPGDLVVLQLILDDHVHVLVVGAVDFSRARQLLLLLLLLDAQTAGTQQLPNGENVHHADDENGKGEREIAVDDRQVEVDAAELLHDVAFFSMVVVVLADVGHDERVDGQEKRDDQDEQADASSTAWIAQDRCLQREVDDDEPLESEGDDDPVSSESERVTKVRRAWNENNDE